MFLSRSKTLRWQEKKIQGSCVSVNEDTLFRTRFQGCLVPAFRIRMQNSGKRFHNHGYKKAVYSEQIRDIRAMTEVKTHSWCGWAISEDLWLPCFSLGWIECAKSAEEADDRGRALQFDICANDCTGLPSPFSSSFHFHTDNEARMKQSRQTKTLEQLHQSVLCSLLKRMASWVDRLTSYFLWRRQGLASHQLRPLRCIQEWSEENERWQVRHSIRPRTPQKKQGLRIPGVEGNTANIKRRRIPTLMSTLTSVNQNVLLYWKLVNYLFAPAVL